MNRWTRLFQDQTGMMAVETAIVAPVLMLMSLGGFQVSQMVTAQHTLDAAAAEAEQIVLAKTPDSQTKLNTIKSIVSTTSGVPQSNITISFVYRCGTSTVQVTSSSMCSSSVATWTYVHINLMETYSPPWKSLGVGSDVALEVDRTVQVS